MAKISSLCLPHAYDMSKATGLDIRPAVLHTRTSVLQLSDIARTRTECPWSGEGPYLYGLESYRSARTEKIPMMISEGPAVNSYSQFSDTRLSSIILSRNKQRQGEDILTKEYSILPSKTGSVSTRPLGNTIEGLIQLQGTYQYHRPKYDVNSSCISKDLKKEVTNQSHSSSHSGNAEDPVSDIIIMQSPKVVTLPREDAMIIKDIQNLLAQAQPKKGILKSSSTSTLADQRSKTPFSSNDRGVSKSPKKVQFKYGDYGQVMANSALPCLGGERRIRSIVADEHSDFPCCGKHSEVSEKTGRHSPTELYNINLRSAAYSRFNWMSPAPGQSSNNTLYDSVNDVDGNHIPRPSSSLSTERNPHPDHRSVYTTDQDECSLPKPNVDDFTDHEKENLSTNWPDDRCEGPAPSEISNLLQNRSSNAKPKLSNMQNKNEVWTDMQCKNAATLNAAMDEPFNFLRKGTKLRARLQTLCSGNNFISKDRIAAQGPHATSATRDSDRTSKSVGRKIIVVSGRPTKDSKKRMNSKDAARPNGLRTVKDYMKQIRKGPAHLKNNDAGKYNGEGFRVSCKAIDGVYDKGNKVVSRQYQNAEPCCDEETTARILRWLHEVEDSDKKV